MKKNIVIILISTLISALITAGGILIYQKYDEKSPEIVYKIYNSNLNRENDKDYPFQYVVQMPEIPETLTFCGEPIPLNNFEVRERLEREFISNTYWHSATFLNMKRAGRWFPLIEQILRKQRIPDDFKYLAVIESNLDNVVSPSKAVGFWQFLEKTAKEYNLIVNENVDERYDVEKSTLAATKYLKKAKRVFGTWTMAAASYNHGIANISEKIVAQKTEILFNMQLTEETSRYIFRLLAVKTIFENPKKYGYSIEQKDLYKPLEFEKVEVNQSIDDLAEWAQKAGINYRILKYYNPWLRQKNLIIPNGKRFFIKVPKSDTIAIIPEDFYSN